MKTADIIVVGGGVIGASIAYNLLRKQPGLKLILVEKELFLGSQATAACTGGIRHQFSTRINIELTKLSLPYFQSFEEAMEYPIYFKQHGYLFVTSREDTVPAFISNVEQQNSLGVPTKLLSPDRTYSDFPYLTTADLLAASYCPLDGYADPYGVVEGYRRQIQKLGGEIRTSEQVTELLVTNEKIAGTATTRERLIAPIVVNAAGAAAVQLIAALGLKLPIRPFKRQVFVSAPVKGIPYGAPLTVDMDTGFYFHREKQGSLLLGGTDKDSVEGFSHVVEWDGFTAVAEAAVKRVPCLEQARIVKAYAGTRMLSADYHAVLGAIGQVPGLYIAAGFSGHGFMHSPAAGLLLAEEIIEGRTSSLDTAPLRPDRFNRDIAKEFNIF